MIEGPNRGAEIALVDGVSVTLGKGDECDIILADPTLPDEPLAIEASASGVLAGGEALPPFHVKTLGATSIAVGPSDAPWEPLVWPKAEEEADGQDAEKQQADSGKGDSASPSPAAAGDGDHPATGDSTSEPTNRQTDKPTNGQTSRRRGGLVAAAAVLLLLLAAIVWLFRGCRIQNDPTIQRPNDPTTQQSSLAALAERHGLVLAEGEDGVTTLSGNLRTRRERLAAFAEARAISPEVKLDITDDESFRTAAEDALFTLTEGAMSVATATNRFLAISGKSQSPSALEQTLKALAADLPWMRDVDVSRVALASMQPAVKPSSRQTVKRSNGPTALPLPICGIMTTPYPCIMMRNGARLMEGAAIGENVILKIGAESVILTNSTGRFTWKP